MLILSRQKGEAIRIGDTVVTVASIHKTKVRLGIEAPKGVAVHRQEVAEAIERNEKATK